MSMHEIVGKAAHEAHGLNLTQCSLDRRVALGVRKGGVDGTDAWIILDFKDNLGELAEIRECGPLKDISAELAAEVAILMTPEVWCKIGEQGKEAAVNIVDFHKNQIDVAGKLSFFIRHTRSIVDLIVVFGKMLSKYSETIQGKD